MADLTQRLFRLLPIVLLWLAWEVVTDAQWVDTAFLPRPRAVAGALKDLLSDGTLLSNLFVTLMTSFSGLTIAIAMGVPIGAMMALFRPFNDFASPLVRMTYSLPKSSLIPLFILWFGIGPRPGIVTVFMASLLPIIVYTSRGISSTPQVLVWSARALGTSRANLAFRVLLPSAQRSIATGIRIALGFSFLLSISSEMIAAKAGIGKLMFMYGENGVYDYMFAALFTVIVAAYAADTALVFLYRHWLRWDETAALGGL